MAAKYMSGAIVTPGSPVSAGIGVLIACSAPGTVRLVLQDGSLIDVYAVVGTALLDDLAVKDVNVAGTTATATVSVLRGG